MSRWSRSPVWVWHNGLTKIVADGDVGGVG